MDKENDPKVKSPNFKKNIVDIISKLQQKPKIEPASNKSLTILMGFVKIKNKNLYNLNINDMIYNY